MEELCALCEEETRQFRQRSLTAGEFCYEVFRRAVVEGNELCWHKLQDIYRSAVAGWCRQAATAFKVETNDVSAFVWEKFWRNYSAEKLAQASGTPAILAYLKMCAGSCAADIRRERNSALSLDEPLPGSDDVGLTRGDLLADTGPLPDEILETEGARETLWAVVRAATKDERERVILRLKFQQDLSAAEIQAMNPKLFPLVNDVYRVTRNLLDGWSAIPTSRRCDE